MNQYPETHHRSSERTSWSIEVTDEHGGTSITIGYADEERARADYARKARAMRRGRTIRLVKSVTVEAWINHSEAIETLEKVVA